MKLPVGADEYLRGAEAAASSLLARLQKAIKKGKRHCEGHIPQGTRTLCHVRVLGGILPPNIHLEFRGELHSAVPSCFKPADLVDNMEPKNGKIII